MNWEKVRNRFVGGIGGFIVSFIILFIISAYSSSAKGIFYTFKELLYAQQEALAIGFFIVPICVAIGVAVAIDIEKRYSQKL